MRSVIQEAASIAQAVELGWIKAGKPKDFTVKIFEEAQKKFFGLITVKKAKIGIFVEDRPQQRSGDQRQQQRRHIPHRRRPHGQQQGQQTLRPSNKGPQQGHQQSPNQHQGHEEQHDHHDGHDHGGEE